MATQGIVTVWQDGGVLYKIVAGCDGYNAKDLAYALLDYLSSKLENVYELAEKNDFGCKECLVVCGRNDKFIFKGDQALGELYFNTFGDPFFNPRWKYGTVGHLYIVIPDANMVIGPPDYDEDDEDG